VLPARKPEPVAVRAPDLRLVGAVLLAIAVLGIALVMPMRDRARLNAARDAWTSRGERPAPPPAESGATRKLQENL
jgi:hypothetical protein